MSNKSEKKIKIPSKSSMQQHLLQDETLLTKSKKVLYFTKCGIAFRNKKYMSTNISLTVEGSTCNKCIEIHKNS